MAVSSIVSMIQELFKQCILYVCTLMNQIKLWIGHLFGYELVEKEVKHSKVLPEKKNQKPKEKKEKVPKLTNRVAASNTKTWNSKHELVYSVIKGQIGDCTSCSFSNNGKHIAIASEDHTIRIYSLKTINDNPPKYLRVVIEGDFADKIGFSEDDKYLVCALNSTHKINVYSVSSEGITLFTQFDIDRYGSINTFDVCGSGALTYVTYTCLIKDPYIRIYSISGNLLSKYNPSQIENYHGNLGIYSNKRYFGLGTFSCDVSIYQLVMTKSLEFTKFTKLFALKGTKTGVLDIDISPAGFAAFITKDNHLFVYNLNVKYDIHEEPNLLADYNFSEIKPTRIFVYPTSRSCILLNYKNVYIVDLRTGNIINTIENASVGEIIDIHIHPQAKVFSVNTNNDKSVRLFKLPEIEE
ncbi:hypothetical protein WA158_008492 [Blastocystis sp. Blastoise]